jgi:hypothetical protein
VLEADLALAGGASFPCAAGSIASCAARAACASATTRPGRRNLHLRVDPKAMVTADALQAPLYARIVGADAVELLGVGPVMVRRDPADARVALDRPGRPRGRVP